LSDSGAPAAGASVIGEVRMSRDAVDGWSMRVEVIVLSACADTLMFRHATSDVRPGQSPDAAALKLAATDPEEPGCVCHSTSWRVQAPDVIVVTYAALPDGEPHGAVPVALEPIVAAEDSTCPQPDELTVQSITTHAVRHLALLGREDPTIRECVRHAPDLWRCIMKTAAHATTIADPDNSTSFHFGERHFTALPAATGRT
jgi:hypothetical protein